MRTCFWHRGPWNLGTMAGTAGALDPYSYSDWLVPTQAHTVWVKIASPSEPADQAAGLSHSHQRVD